MKRRSSEGEADLKLMRRANEILSSDGDIQEALRLLAEVNHPDHRPEAQRFRASLLHGLERYEEALAVLDEVLADDPGSELASVQRFHALWRLERVEEAYDEMDRYLADYESWEYRRLRKEMKDEGYPPRRLGTNPCKDPG